MSNLLTSPSTINLDTSRPYASLITEAGGSDLTGTPAHQALAQAGLDFEAVRLPMAVNRDGYYVDAPGIFGICNPYGHCYGAVGTGYHILQHQAMGNVLERLGLNVTQVINLKHGQSGLLVASLAQQDIGGDPLRMSLYLQNSHGGVGSFRAGFGVERLFCSNQFQGIFRSGLFHAHTRSIQHFADSLAERIDLQQQAFITQAEALRRMRETTIGVEAARWILERTFRDQLAAPIRDKDSGEMRERTLEDLPMVDRVRVAYRDGRAIESTDTQHSVYRMFNAVTQVITHDDPRQAKDPVEAARRRLEGILQGTRANQLDYAREACEQLLKV